MVKFFDRSQGLVASRIAGWAPRSSSCGLVVLLASEKKRSEKKRSGQAGLLVPKAATARKLFVSLSPLAFATWEGDGGKMLWRHEIA